MFLEHFHDLRNRRGRLRCSGDCVIHQEPSYAHPFGGGRLFCLGGGRMVSSVPRKEALGSMPWGGSPVETTDSPFSDDVETLVRPLIIPGHIHKIEIVGAFLGLEDVPVTSNEIP